MAALITKGVEIMAKQTIYNAGIYVRLSQEDMRAGESLSIEHQKMMLTKYVKEQGWNLIDIYVDDGYSGTDFDRPGVQRLLEDAKNGNINLIICKDLSRFGRNYIQVGQYIDYIFPIYKIRFIALGDNVDTADKESTALDMMPIVNIFNEWHAASTSKKIKAVLLANAKAGKYRCCNATYGYDKDMSSDKRTPIVDPYSSQIVKKIFLLRSQGISPKHIAQKLNEEHILIPSDYHYQKIGKPNPRITNHLWSNSQVNDILRNQIYLGHLVQMKTETVSYKNHKTVNVDPEDWIVIKNNHEPIITQEIWDKVREVEASVSQGKRDKKGITAPLSGLMYCADCGFKMRLCTNNTTAGSKKKPRKYYRQNYNCGNYVKAGTMGCKSHYIKLTVIEDIILEDIKSMTQLTIDEKAAKKLFMAKKLKEHNAKISGDAKRQNEIRKRLAELEKIMQTLYEDRVLGKIAEDVCSGFLDKYQAEKNALEDELAVLMESINSIRKDEQDVDEFIRRLKKYADAEKLTREMALELIEYVTVDEFSKERLRDIHIYYKLLDKSLNNKRNALL